MATLLLMGLFGTAGIRSKYLELIDVEFGYRLGMAVARTLGGRIVVGWDGRRFSRMLGQSVMGGVEDVGGSVVCLGVSPTPVISYWVKKLRVDGGVVVTASHNPPEYAGFKVLDSSGREAGERVEREIEERIRQGGRGDWDGEVEETVFLDPFPVYVDEFEGFRSGELFFVVDGGGGVAGRYTANVLSRSSRVMGVNIGVDPYFSSRHPEPRADVLSRFGMLVKSVGGDVGFAHDGDGDRLAVVDERGRFVDMSSVIALFAKWVLEERNGRLVVSVDVGRAVYDVAEMFNAEVKVVRLGRVERNVDGKTVFAAEPWKIVMPEWGVWADGIRAAYIIAERMSKAGKTFSKLLEFEGIRRYPGIRKSVYFHGDKQCFMRFIRDEAVARIRKVGKVLEELYVDGVKIVTDKGWVLFRVSGTEPKARLYVEAIDEKELRLLYKAGIELVRRGVKMCGG